MLGLGERSIDGLGHVQRGERMGSRDSDVGESRVRANDVASLVDNAFALLRVSPRADVCSLNEAFDRLSFEQGQNPDLLDAARARLLNPRALARRLTALA